ncbi:MAG: ATP-dependent Clp protease ATP-binding subunit [Bacteroidales bacterium]|jgi:ATP-dependent Clp protease ATP-binding subunit ClpC|nr:ATP-dependent Clp protease ATP-binding subunit [Bacteroidales bacterium]
MNIPYSENLKRVIYQSRVLARNLGHNYIAPEHLMLAMLDSSPEQDAEIANILSKLNVDSDILKRDVKLALGAGSSVTTTATIDEIPLLSTTERIMRIVRLEASALRQTVVDTPHLFLAIMHESNTRVQQILNNYHVTYDRLLSIIDNRKAKEAKDSYLDDDEEDDGPFSKSSGSGNADNRQHADKKPASNSDTPVLDNFSTDISKAAEEGRLDPVVGRENEIERLAQILSRRKKNNPILIGEPGVGKSAIAEGLALRIHRKEVSRVLFDKRIVSLDLASIVAGTKYRGQFEERIKAILGELSHSPNVILFIDEIHTLVGAGGATGSLDAANMLKPALARGEIQCIGATTLDEYRQYIEKDGALERRFQKVMVEPTTFDETVQILRNIKDKYENHHNVTYTDEALKACVALTERYMSDRHLPDKAIDALDEAGSRVHISNIVVPQNIVEIEAQVETLKNNKLNAVKAQNFELAASFRDQEKQLSEQLVAAKNAWQNELKEHREVVDDQKVAEVVAMMTGIPLKRVAQAESQRLLTMGNELKGSVVGQDEAISKVVKAIQRNRAGLKDPNRPIGSFIFLGPTGVGKTHLAQVLAKYLFDSTDALIRVDMSEYMEKFAVSRLVGAPPGYVGHEEGGQLTEKVRRRPYCVVLLDEIEKAHPDVFNLLLQVLDEGHLTDSLGRKVDFKNTIIIMTSNIGSRELKEFGRGVGFAQENRPSDAEHSNAILQKALKKAFAPEFINRIDDVIIFQELSRDNIMQIIDIELRGLTKRVEAMGYSLSVTDAAKAFIVDKSYDSQYGARPLRRAIQKYIEDELAELIIEAQVKQSSKIVVDCDGEKIITSCE